MAHAFAVAARLFFELASDPHFEDSIDFVDKESACLELSGPNFGSVLEVEISPAFEIVDDLESADFLDGSDFAIGSECLELSTELAEVSDPFRTSMDFAGRADCFAVLSDERSGVDLLDEAVECSADLPLEDDDS